MARARWQLTQERVQAVLVDARAVVDSGRPLTPGWLEQAAAWIGEVTPSWEQLTGEAPLERTYRRLAASLQMEAWLICWPTDVHLQLHDHGGASGAFQVVEGVLEERSLVNQDGFGLLGGGDDGLGGAAPVLRERSVPAGEVVAFDGSYIHDVRNLGAPAATSVHIYSAASNSMSFYRLDGGLVRTVGPLTERALRIAESDAEHRAGDSRSQHPSTSRRLSPAAD